MDQIWKKLPQDVKDEYGEEFRKNCKSYCYVQVKHTQCLVINQWMSGVDLVANEDLSEVINAYVSNLLPPVYSNSFVMFYKLTSNKTTGTCFDFYESKSPIHLWRRCSLPLYSIVVFAWWSTGLSQEYNGYIILFSNV
jgi:hypothetical protein